MKLESKLEPNLEALELWVSAGEDPADLVNWFVGENPFYTGAECVIHTGYPRFVAWFNGANFIFDFSIWKDTLRVEWLEPGGVSDKDKREAIQSAWHFLTLDDDFLGDY